MGLDGLEVVLAIEEVYGITVPDDLSGIRTVQNLSDLVCRLLREQKKLDPQPEAVMVKVIEIVKKMSSRWGRNKVTPESKLKDVLSM